MFREDVSLGLLDVNVSGPDICKAAIVSMTPEAVSTLSVCLELTTGRKSFPGRAEGAASVLMMWSGS
jgi:hypothetical protein